MAYPCRIAILDSGINASHPDVGNIVGGIQIVPSCEPDNLQDLLGHGTAVAGAIREKAPKAGLLIVKIYDRALDASIDQLAAGLAWAMDNRADIINVSLGTCNPRHRARLEPLVQRAVGAGVQIVAARLLAGNPCYPGCMHGVVAVDSVAQMPREQVRFEDDTAFASPYPPPIPGLPPERSLSGISFAVANVSGYLGAVLTAARTRDRVAQR